MTTLENLCILKRASLSMGDALKGGGCGALHLRSHCSVVGRCSLTLL